MGKSKLSFLNDEILHLYNRKPKLSYREIARIITEERYPNRKDVTYNGLRRYISRLISELGGDVKNYTSSKSNDYKSKEKFVLSAWNNETGLMMDIDEYCCHYNLPRRDISSYKLVSHTGTPFYNIVFKENVTDSFSVDFKDVIDEAVSKHIKPVKIYSSSPKLEYDTVDRLVYSDAHVGMCVNPNGFGMYGGKWDEDELMSRCDTMIKCMLDTRKSDELYIDDLGDFLDGWNAETTRGGHKLPQNMDNEKSFKVGLNFKMNIIDNLIPYFESITVRNVCEDNHAGSFAYVLNHAFKEIVKAKYSNSVKVVNQRRFIDYYTVGDHAIVTSHGKDSSNLKFGFKPHLDPKQIEKVDQYLKSEGVYKESKYVRFCKGDSHQALFDMSGSDDFDYFNYPAFSPSSNWVQTNFKKGRSGFVIEHFNKFERKVSINPFWFDWKND